MSRTSPPPPSNRFQQVYNINPNLPAAYLLPAVQGTMDVSQQWPLALQLKVFDYTAPVGTSSTVISRPPSNSHELLVSVYITISSPATQTFVLFMTNTQNSGPTANTGLSRIACSATVSQAPLIGSGLFYGGSATIYGTPAPLYVPFPYSVTVSVVGAAGGESVTLRSLSMRLPASQPFTALLDLW